MPPVLPERETRDSGTPAGTDLRSAASSRRIEDYALIGDCHTAALVHREGAVEWLCWPAFDSDACFAALLGNGENGRWTLAPRAPVEARSRRYLPEALVLETRLRTAGGEAVVLDFMPPRGAVSRLVRIIRVERGEMGFSSELSLRFGYGALQPWLRKAQDRIFAVAGPDGVVVAGDRPWRVRGADCRCEFSLRAGEEAAFSLSYYPSHEPPPEPPDARRELAACARWWRDWVGRCGYQGPWREAVIRSLITLKALSYGPTGGFVAAPTSSLPENLGGGRNWDYRFCWLRDATFTMLCLLQTGYEAEAAAWRDWLLRAAAGDPEDLQPIYTLRGRRRLVEWEAPWLAGFDGSRPVRFGNAASTQQQLDTFGEVVDALFQAERNGASMTAAEHRLQSQLVAHVAKIWRRPDRGIWEVRGRPRRFTHSQAMAWAALDRGVQAAEQFGMEAPLESWRTLRDRMRAEICERAYNPALGAFTQALDSDVLDASVLLLPHVGFVEADDPRMVGTVERIQQRLMCDGFLRRYDPKTADDGAPGSQEGVFLACTLWLAENLALQGRGDEAADLIERVLAVRNDVGLLSEEYDPGAGVLTGNFPQALSHLALVNAILTLSGWGPAQARGSRGRDGVTGGARPPARSEAQPTSKTPAA
ncbi:glycoside hydrolase family 15 protein [Phenylobacterium sp.]|uniref:glycoside hydrolase family 15 protein n=1 Tax=Phenylobacterium sp. TaxID=1871053 RepID=UPI00260EAD83|nr:glycoside hydrolase family 15 protein [Phenylobacterium sp.]